jgi:ABC-type uncharacterized transport system permease subunit
MTQNCSNIIFLQMTGYILRTHFQFEKQDASYTPDMLMLYIQYHQYVTHTFVHNVWFERSDAIDFKNKYNLD